MKRQESSYDICDTSHRQKQPKKNESPPPVEKSRSSPNNNKRWTTDQDMALRQAIEHIGQKNWKAIAEHVEGRNHAQCLQRWNKVLKPGLVKGHWNFDEDTILERMVLKGCHSWGEVSHAIPGRSAKQCRERWRNHLDPSISKHPFSSDEDSIVQSAYAQLGNRWTQIATMLPGRTDDAVKSRWKILNPDAVHRAKPGRPRALTTSTKMTSQSLSERKKNETMVLKPALLEPPAMARSISSLKSEDISPEIPALLEIKTRPVISEPRTEQDPKEKDLSTDDQDVLTQSDRLKFLSLESIHLLSGWSDMYNPEETEDFMITSGALKSFLRSQERANAELLVSLAHPESSSVESLNGSSSSCAIQGLPRRHSFSKQSETLDNVKDREYEPHHPSLDHARESHLPAMNSYYLSEPRQVQASPSSGQNMMMETALRGIKDEYDPLMLQSFKYYHQDVTP